MFISGTLPTLVEGAEVIYSDHEEEYRREGPGNNIVFTINLPIIILHLMKIIGIRNLEV